MNFINCGAASSVQVMRKAVVFWSENNVQHITRLLQLSNGTTAVLEDFFKQQLKICRDKFIAFGQSFRQKEMPLSSYQEFLKLNGSFANLLERIKFEAFAGYPVLQQSVFHYIYEARYINAVFSAKNMCGNVLISTQFAPFLNNMSACFYNQIYFWGIVGAQHPSLLINNNTFYNAINGYAKEYLTGVTNDYNRLNFKLSSLKRPLKKATFLPLFEEFVFINQGFLEFLQEVKSTSPKVFSSPMMFKLPTAFYETVEHQIAEHKLVGEISQNIAKHLK